MISGKLGNLSTPNSHTWLLTELGSGLDPCPAPPTGSGFLTPPHPEGTLVGKEGCPVGPTRCLKYSRSSRVSVSALAMTGTMLTTLLSRFMNSMSRGRRLERNPGAEMGSPTLPDAKRVSRQGGQDRSPTEPGRGQTRPGGPLRTDLEEAQGFRDTRGAGLLSPPALSQSPHLLDKE